MIYSVVTYNIEQFLQEKEVKKHMACMCADERCPVHPGSSRCVNEHTITLYRVDMVDDSGTWFCDECGEDAMESGLYSDQQGEENNGEM